MSPVHDADVVAEAIVRLAAKPRREQIVGGAGRLLRQQRLTSPRLYERMTAEHVAADHFADDPAEPSAGNVLEPSPEWTGVSGGWASSPGPLRRALPSLALVGAATVVVKRVGR